MNNDDDLFVLIIGDEYKQEQVELMQKDTEKNNYLKKTYIQNEEFFQLGCDQNNIELSENTVKLKLDEYSRNKVYDFIYNFETESAKNNEISSDEEKQTIRRRKLTCYERRSYVSELKEKYPELKEDRELLINCLAEVMKALKPPPLPQDYFVMNGIMFQCVKCGSETESIPAAGRHYHERHGDRYLICYACGADFRIKTNLYKHERVCSAPDINVTLKARALFLGQRKLKTLMSNEPKIERKKALPGRFKCTMCSAVFASKRGLQTHSYFHSGERPFLCPHCPSSYTSQTTLSRHITHTHGDRYYECDHCQRQFKIKSALVLHMNTHEPLKKYACSECANRYATKASLLLHVSRDHRGQPLPFACHICSKRYPWSSSLKDHMKKVHGMVLLTRQGFFKKLPNLSSAQLQQAKVILKKDLNGKKR